MRIMTLNYTPETDSDEPEIVVTVDRANSTSGKVIYVTKANDDSKPSSHLTASSAVDAAMGKVFPW